MPTTIYLDCAVLACVAVTKPNGTTGTQLVVDDKDVPALKQSGLVAWVDDAKSELPAEWSKLDAKSGKREPLHAFLGLEPRPVAKVDATEKPVDVLPVEGVLP